MGSIQFHGIASYVLFVSLWLTEPSHCAPGRRLAHRVS
jgi:hypothetical protein